ncbi:histidine kinase, partial [Pseudomonas sp. NZIPFR-PS2]
MRLKSYLHQISPVLSTPNAARRLLRIFALVLLVGILGGVYSFLLFTFNNEISQRRSYMSSAIAEAHTFFTTREAVLESLSLSATRNAKLDLPVSDEEIRLLLGNTPGKQWSIWLTERMRAFLKSKQLNLLYVSTDAQVLRLYDATPVAADFPAAMLEQLHALKQQKTLQVDHSAGDFTMFNTQGMPLFSNSHRPPPGQNLPHLRQQDFFGFVGDGWLPEQIVLRKQLKSSDWQLTYSIDLRAVLWALWPQMLGALLFCLLTISLVCLLTRRLEHRFITPAIHRIQALVESELFSRDVIQTAPVALCVLRRTDGAEVLKNTLAQQWLGERGAQLGPGWIRQAFDPDAPSLTDYFEAADGRHLYLSCAPTRYKGEDVLLCAFSDISARTQIEAALEQARQSADAANEAKTLFLATMSHEIRTPLYGVLGTLELLARTRLDAQQKSYLHAIEGSSATLLQLICDVLDVSKIEAGQLALELSEFCVPTLVQEVVQGYAAAAHSKGLQLYACLDPQLPRRLIGDASRVRQILNNLLSNAVKFTDSGRVVLRVKKLGREGERVCLQWQISDTGKGIAPADQAFIFEPFYQSEGNSHVIAGTGLGLPICLRLTHLMNGTLRMVWLRRWGARAQVGLPTSTQLAGHCVLLELMERHLDLPWQGPRVLASNDGAHEPQFNGDGWQVNLNDLDAIQQAVRHAQNGQVVPPQTRCEARDLRPLHLHILVAEDNVINQLILRDQLEELGCSVELAGDGEDALARWHEGTFDVVL